MSSSIKIELFTIYSCVTKTNIYLNLYLFCFIDKRKTSVMNLKQSYKCLYFANVCFIKQLFKKTLKINNKHLIFVVKPLYISMIK